MAGSKTDLYETQVLNAARGTTLTSWTPFVGLLTVLTNGETSSVTEVAVSGYARQSVTFGAPSAGVMLNTNLITFNTASAGYGVVIGGTINTLVTGGQANYYFDMTSETVNQNNTLTFPIGNISITEG